MKTEHSRFLCHSWNFLVLYKLQYIETTDELLLLFHFSTMLTKTRY